MLQDILKNHSNSDVLWIGSQFEDFQVRLQKVAFNCENIPTSFQAMNFLEEYRQIYQSLPIVIIESAITQLDRHWFKRVVQQLPEYSDIKILHLGKLNDSLTKEYFKIFEQVADLFKSVDIIVSGNQSASSVSSIKPLENYNLLLLENNSTRRLIAHGLLNSLRIKHDIYDHLPDEIEMAAYDICLVSYELLDLEGVISSLSNANRFIVMGGATQYPTLASPLREQDIVEVLSPKTVDEVVQESSEETPMVEFDVEEFSFDINEITARLGVSMSIVKLVIDTYVKDLSAQIFRLEESIESADPEEIRSASHLIKGSSSTVGLDEISTFAAMIEKLATQDVNKGGLNDNTATKACELLQIIKQFEESASGALFGEETHHG